MDLTTFSEGASLRLWKVRKGRKGKWAFDSQKAAKKIAEKKGISSLVVVLSAAVKHRKSKGKEGNIPDKRGRSVHLFSPWARENDESSQPKGY